MTSRVSHHRSRKGRANARPLQDSETIASTDDDILESLIDTFPASDPPAWVATARVGIPHRKPTSRRARKLSHLLSSQQYRLTLKLSLSAVADFGANTPSKCGESEFGRCQHRKTGIQFVREARTCP